MTIASFAPAATLPLQNPAIAGFRHFCADLQVRFGCDEVVVLSTLPRGGLQVCRRLHLHEGLIRRYHADNHAVDKLAWNAIKNGVSTPDPVDPKASHHKDTDSPLSYGWVTVLAVRVDAPVFAGYPGVVLIMRRKQSKARTPINAQDDADEVRRLFRTHVQSKSEAVPERPTSVYAFDGNGQCILGDESLARLDSYASAQIRDLVTRQLAQDEPISPVGGRTCVGSTSGVLTPVELTSFDHYPALADGRVIFVAIHPVFDDWASLKPEMFEADLELSRLTLAVKFMVEHFHESPTLDQISKSVQLSQFHFHRRFTDMFGITPKHMLFGLQIDKAKRMLADADKELVDIADACGFSHQSHFTSRFKQGAGITPTRWYRMMANRAAQGRSPVG